MNRSRTIFAMWTGLGGTLGIIECHNRCTDDVNCLKRFAIGAAIFATAPISLPMLIMIHDGQIEQTLKSKDAKHILTYIK